VWHGCWCQTGHISQFSQFAQLLGFLVFTKNGVKKEKHPVCGSPVGEKAFDARGQRRNWSEITTRYHQGMQQSICEATTRTILRRMGYKSRWPHWVPLIWTTNRKKRLQFARAHQNWTVEDWKNVACSNESQFLLRHSDGRVRIWRKQNDNLDPSCLVTTVQAGGGGGVMVWGMFSWHTLGPLVLTWHRLNATVYLSSVSDHVHPFIYLSSDDLQKDNVLKSFQIGFLNMTISSLY